MQMTASELVAHIQEGYDGELVEATASADVDVWIGVPPADVTGMAAYLNEAFAPLHLSTITGLDNGEAIEVLYHFVVNGLSLNLRAAVPKSGDSIDSITPVIPAAVLYEREVMDLLGLVFTGHPDPRRLILPEDAPEDEHPLRRDAQPEEETQQDNG